MVGELVEFVENRFAGVVADVELSALKADAFEAAGEEAVFGLVDLGRARISGWTSRC